MVCHLPQDPLNTHAKYILSSAPPKAKSWFQQIRDLCSQYGLSNPLQLLDVPVPKEAFKARVKLKVTEYWQALLRMEAAPLRSLQYFKPELYSLNKPHYMWMSAASNPFECSKSTILVRMASGRYRTEILSKHWSDNKAGHCKAPSCDQIPGTLEHLLVGCPALDTVRQRLYIMWLERTVMFPTLHSTIKDVLNANDQTQMQFILEPLAFPQIQTSFKTHGQRFIDQLSYLTRTFAFYIHREYQKIVKQLKETPPYSSIPVIKVANFISIPGMSEDLHPPSSHVNTTCFQPVTQACTSVPRQYSPGQPQPADPDSHHSVDVPCQQPLVPEVVPASGSDGQCLAVLCQYSSGTSQSVPSNGVRTCPDCVRLPTPSSTPSSSVSDYSVQACTAALQGSDSAKAVQLLSKCQLSVCSGQGSVSDFIV